MMRLVESQAYGGVELTFGERVRDARLRAGMSVADLAQKCGLSETYIRNIERNTGGAKRPSIATVESLARALGVSVDWLTHGDSGQDEGAKGEDGDADDEIEDMIRRIARAKAPDIDPAETEEFLRLWWSLPRSVKRLIQLQAETYTKLAQDYEEKSGGDKSAPAGG